jgi:hypothetical protein
MAVELTDAGFKKIGLDTPEPWVDLFNGNWDLLQSLNAVGGCAVRARDLDPTTYLPTSLSYMISGGYTVYGGHPLALDILPGAAVDPSSQTYIWIDSAGIPFAGPAFPVNQSYAPLALIVSDATKITSVVDLRNPVRSLGGPLAVARVAITADYSQAVGTNYIRVDATNGPITVTLGPVAINAGSLIIIRKTDTSANAVTIAATEGIEGGASISLAAQGSVVLASDGTTYEIAI